MPSGKDVLMGKSRATAAERLRQRMKDEGWNQAQLCVALGADPAMVSRWLKGLRRPSLRLAHRIEERLGIPAEAWIVAKAS